MYQFFASDFTENGVYAGFRLVFSCNDLKTAKEFYATFKPKYNSDESELFCNIPLL